VLTLLPAPPNGPIATRRHLCSEYLTCGSSSRWHCAWLLVFGVAKSLSRSWSPLTTRGHRICIQQESRPLAHCRDTVCSVHASKWSTSSCRPVSVLTVSLDGLSVWIERACSSQMHLTHRLRDSACSHLRRSSPRAQLTRAGHRLEMAHIETAAVIGRVCGVSGTRLS